MTKEVLLVVGQIAGVGGLALGVLLLLFRDVIRKSIFSNLNTNQSYRLLRLILILVWTVALAGLASWVYVSVTNNANTNDASLDEDTIKQINDYFSNLNKRSGVVAWSQNPTGAQLDAVREHIDRLEALHKKQEDSIGIPTDPPGQTHLMPMQ